MNPIQTAVKGIRRMKYEKGNDLSYFTYLKNCRYQVRAHFEWNMNRPELAADRNENKHHNIAKRMIERGGRRDIFLGTRECQGYIVPCAFGSGKGYYDDTPELAFGLTYHGLTYADEAYSDQTEDKMTVRFWYPVMQNGVLEFVRPEDCSITRTVREMKIKPGLERKTAIFRRCMTLNRRCCDWVFCRRATALMRRAALLLGLRP